MLVQPSMLSLAACVLYAIVAIAAFVAARAAKARGQQNWHLRTWIVVLVFFVLLIGSRLLGIEEVVRAELRTMLGAQGLVESRRAIQGPVIAVLLGLIFASAMMTVYWVAQRISGRRNIAVAVALGACGVMLAIIAMRTISLHSLDRFLDGSLKLNWVGDIGASFAVLGAACFYTLVINGKMPRKR